MVENTISIIKENECTGCGACFNKCPVQAIRMQENKEGFLFPQIDESACVHCGQCLNICPVHKIDYYNWENPECYAACALSIPWLQSHSIRYREPSIPNDRAT